MRWSSNADYDEAKEYDGRGTIPPNLEMSENLK